MHQARRSGVNMSDELPFEGILGNTCKLRFLENLIANGYSQFNMNDLVAMAGGAGAASEKAIASFLKWGIIKNVEEQEGETQYVLDRTSPLVICMTMFNEAIILKMYPGLLEEIQAAERAEKSGVLKK